MERYVRLRSLGKGYGEMEIQEDLKTKDSGDRKSISAMVKTEKETDRTTGTVLFLFVSDGCFSKETKAHPL